MESLSITSSLLISLKTQVSPTWRLFSFANEAQPAENEPCTFPEITNLTSHDQSPTLSITYCPF